LELWFWIIHLICHMQNLPHCRRNELCYLGFVFAIDSKMMVIGNTHGVQLGGFHNVVFNWVVPPWCLCHMNILEFFSLLKIGFHLNVIKPIHTWIPYKHPQNYVSQLCFYHIISRYFLTTIGFRSLSLYLFMCYKFSFFNYYFYVFNLHFLWDFYFSWFISFFLDLYFILFITLMSF
jgi:hypothetical protein